MESGSSPSCRTFREPSVQVRMRSTISEVGALLKTSATCIRLFIGSDVNASFTPKAAKTPIGVDGFLIRYS